jgi:chromosome segregation ATPase
MYLKELEITGFKSFAKKSNLKFDAPISAIVGPNGSGKSNVAEAFRFVLGEQSFKSMRGKRGEDLIFNGTQSVGRMPKANVKVTFDNEDKALPIDFEEVTLERTVHRDGVNEYAINGSPARLKDISELLASANIGSSGHHIISQGEADRILNSSPKERKAMLEDALGLKIFQYKKHESERKLTKTEENIAQVQSLRKEIAPHLKFLKKQVEKIEQGKQMKLDLLADYKEYLSKESAYLSAKKKELAANIDEPKKRLVQIDSEIAEAESVAQKDAENQGENESAGAIKKLETQISELTTEKENLLKEEGRIEGQINSLEKIAEKEEKKEDSVSVDRQELIGLKQDIAKIKSESESLSDVGSLKQLLSRAMDLVQIFLNNKTKDEDAGSEIRTEIDKNKNRQNEIRQTLQQISEKESGLRQEISDLRRKLDEDKSSSLEAEKKIVVLMSEKNEIQQEISKHAIALDNLERDDSAFKQEITEAVVLVGHEVMDYEKVEVSGEEMLSEPRENQIESRKKLERLKIKVEEIGGGSGQEIIKEFDEATERDEFLIREIEDLEKSAADLKSLIVDLGEKIEKKFHEGVKKINNEFQEFFELMFGGGTASIAVTKIETRKRRDTDIDFNEDDMDNDSGDGDNEGDDGKEKSEEGIEVKVNLPRKKISGLMMLSGGERALTSIALLFAISQVNPPPFVILDETDAALDEANSRKYGDMIENLSKNSQLILITHNRETMSRAGVLYGITMTGGVSQMLSVAFDEGTQWAK